MERTGKPAPNAKIRDLDQLETFMRLKPTLADTAAFFKVGIQTVEDTIRRHYDLTFREFREQNMVHTRMMLIRTALGKAKGGDNTMLIFCLKNLCGWADKMEQVLPEGGHVVQLNYKLEDEDGETKAKKA